MTPDTRITAELATRWIWGGRGGPGVRGIRQVCGEFRGVKPAPNGLPFLLGNPCKSENALTLHHFTLSGPLSLSYLLLLSLFFILYR